jgi:ABC-2 type transport system permease protein
MVSIQEQPQITATEMPINMLTAVLRALRNEFRKEILLIWTYKFNLLIAQTFILGLIFVGAGFVIGNGRFNPHQLAPVLLGYLLWVAARVVILYTYESFTTETQSGTMEQMYMSVAPSELLVLMRMIATLLIPIIIMAFTATILVFLLGIQFPLHWEGIPIILITMLGIFGIGLMLGGAILLFKQMSSLADLVQQVLLFLSGVLIPISNFPAWLALIAQLMPITQGIIVLRQVVLGGLSLAAVWTNGSLIWLCINSAVYLLGGWLIFKWCERIAKQRGSLGQY